MNLDQGGDSETRFAEYVAGLGSVIGRVERTRPLRDYCMGLMLPGERKSVEPRAARSAPARTAAEHQSLLHFVAKREAFTQTGRKSTPWSRASRTI